MQGQIELRKELIDAASWSRLLGRVFGELLQIVCRAGWTDTSSRACPSEDALHT
jgi:hypothetical protein